MLLEPYSIDDLDRPANEGRSLLVDANYFYGTVMKLKTPIPNEEQPELPDIQSVVAAVQTIQNGRAPDSIVIKILCDLKATEWDCLWPKKGEFEALPKNAISLLWEACHSPVPLTLPCKLTQQPTPPLVPPPTSALPAPLEHHDSKPTVALNGSNHILQEKKSKQIPILPHPSVADATQLMNPAATTSTTSNKRKKLDDDFDAIALNTTTHSINTNNRTTSPESSDPPKKKGRQLGAKTWKDWEIAILLDAISAIGPDTREEWDKIPVWCQNENPAWSRSQAGSCQKKFEKLVFFKVPENALNVVPFHVKRARMLKDILTTKMEHHGSFPNLSSNMPLAEAYDSTPLSEHGDDVGCVIDLSTQNSALESCSLIKDKRPMLNGNDIENNTPSLAAVKLKLDDIGNDILNAATQIKSAMNRFQDCIQTMEEETHAYTSTQIISNQTTTKAHDSKRMDVIEGDISDIKNTMDSILHHLRKK